MANQKDGPKALTHIPATLTYSCGLTPEAHCPDCLTCPDCKALLAEIDARAVAAAVAKLGHRPEDVSARSFKSAEEAAAFAAMLVTLGIPKEAVELAVVENGQVRRIGTAADALADGDARRAQEKVARKADADPDAPRVPRPIGFGKPSDRNH